MIKDRIKEGFILKEKKLYKGAIEAFYKALEEDNTSTELLYEIADLYLCINNEEKALNYIEQILEINPVNIEALKLLQKIFESKKALEKAEKTAKNIYCISSSEDDLACYLRLLIEQEKFSEVLKYEKDTENQNLLIEFARASFYMKDFSKAEKFSKKAIELNSNNTNNLILLGLILYAQNKNEECINLFYKLEEDNNNPNYWNLAGLVNVLSKNYDAAIECFSNAIKLDNKNELYYYNIANTALKNGDLKLARKNYNYAISINPNNKNYKLCLANLYYQEKHYKRALEELPDDIFEGKLLKAVILYDSGYLGASKKVFKELSEENPDNEIIKNYQEKINYDLGL